MMPSGRSGWAVAAALAAFGATGCERDTSGLGPAPVDTDPAVFLDDFADGVIFQPFLDTKVDVAARDLEQRQRGTASLRITVPGPGDDTGLYAGGAFTAEQERDLTSYNALTFWAKGSRTATLDVAGLGNDNTGTSRYTATRFAIPVTPEWTKIVLPVPLPDRHGLERGLFFFAEGFEQDQGYTLWFDEVQFENLATVTNPRPTLLPATRSVFVGQTVAMQDTRTTFAVDGSDVTVFHTPSYFTFLSSDESVAQVAGDEVRIVGGGTAFITARLGDVVAGGRVTLNSSAPPPDTAPTPAVPAADVISLFSNAYVDRPVDTWSTSWDTADVTDLSIAGDDLKAYTGLGFAGIEFATPTIDASAMTHFHVDVWAPDGFFIKLKLVDFGADGRFGGGNDTESAEIGFLIANGEWVGFDIPLSSFTGLGSRAHLAQWILLGNPSVLYVDNVYFHR